VLFYAKAVPNLVRQPHQLVSKVRGKWSSEVLSWGKKPGRDQVAERYVSKLSTTELLNTTYLAAVANTLVGGLLGAVTADVTDLTTVVALLSLGAVTAHVAETAAGVAGLTTLATTTGTAEATTITATATTKVAALLAVSTALGAVAGDVTDLAALVAVKCQNAIFLYNAFVLTTPGRHLAGHRSHHHHPYHLVDHPVGVRSCTRGTSVQFVRSGSKTSP
jgi:hypothetical protein